MGFDYEWAIVNRLQLLHDDDWTFTSMNSKADSPTFYS